MIPTYPNFILNIDNSDVANAKVNLGYDGVRTRLIALFQKTNCHTQGELIAFAFKHNILLQEGGEIVINPEIDMEGD